MKKLNIISVLSLEQVWNKYYKDRFIKKFKEYKLVVPFSEDRVYNTFKLMMLRDPTYKEDKMGKYGKWIAEILLKYDKMDWNRLAEDSYKFTDYLKLFDKLKKEGVITGGGADINSYKSINELYKFLKYWIKKNIKTKEDMKKEKFKKEIKVLYEDSNWLILQPKSFEASCFYGSDTNWCTAKDSAMGKGYYKSYTKDGPLTIIIHKKRRKY